MIGIIIQARTGSMRLPKKMILPFFKGKGILQTILIRIKKANLNIPVVLATTTNPTDDFLAEIALKQEIPVFKGSEHNVLNRFIKAGEKHGLDKIIRICADNPFLDLTALEIQIKAFCEMDVDYWCYALSDDTPTIKTHYGFWTEGVKLSALKKVAEYTDDRLYQEHVTNYIYSNPNQFSIHFEPIEKTIEQEKNVRLTIDTEDDFKLGQKIYSNLNELELPATAINILKYLNENPEYFETMKNEIAKNTK
jgi:spore coat polysaccharide biosynthesis protein SpsF